VGGKDQERSRLLSEEVVKLLRRKYPGGHPRWSTSGHRVEGPHRTATPHRQATSCTASSTEHPRGPACCGTPDGRLPGSRTGGSENST
jgi:hypothetical protein